MKSRIGDVIIFCGILYIWSTNSLRMDGKAWSPWNVLRSKGMKSRPRGRILTSMKCEGREDDHEVYELQMLEIPERYKSGDWLSAIRTLPHSRILRRIRSHLLFNTGWALLIAFLHQQGWESISIPPQPHSLMASALGLLLVFRTNAAYDRYWEARKLLGVMNNTIRDMARMLVCYAPNTYHDQLLRLLQAFPYSLMMHLQGYVDFTELEGNLSPDLVEYIRNIQDIKCVDAVYQGEQCMNIPLLVLTEFSVIFRESLDTFDSKPQFVSEVVVIAMYQSIERLVGELHNVLGSCERILTTPVPLSYSRHTSRFLTIFCFTLPFALVDNLGYLVVPVMSAICWGLFAIEEIGHFIEEPFNRNARQLPIERVCAICKNDIDETRRLMTPRRVESELKRQRINGYQYEARGDYQETGTVDKRAVGREELLASTPADETTHCKKDSETGCNDGNSSLNAESVSKGSANANSNKGANAN